MKRIKRITFFSTLFAFLMTNVVKPFVPALLATGAPVFGGIMAAKSASAQSTLDKVEATIIYVKLFLIFAFLYIAFMWFMNLYKLMKGSRKSYENK